MHPAQDSVQKTTMKHSAGLFDTLPKSCFHAKSLYWKALNVLTAIWSLNTEGHLTTARHLSVPCPVLWHLTKEKHICDDSPCLVTPFLILHTCDTEAGRYILNHQKAETVLTVSLFCYVVALKCLERVILVV